MAKGDFYFPFLYQRFYTSTKGWTEEQEGAYMRLLTYQFDKGSIPDDLKIIKIISPKAAKYWSLFESKFEKNADGNLINIVMAEIRSDIQNKKHNNQVHGKLGGRPKNQKVSLKKPSGYENNNQMVSKNETETKPIPLTINQYPIEREIPGTSISEIRGVVESDAEKVILGSPIWLEQLFMRLKIIPENGKISLRKFHLHLEATEAYPKPKKALFAGFEKWLMNESKFSKDQPADTQSSFGKLSPQEEAGLKLLEENS